MGLTTIGAFGYLIGFGCLLACISHLFSYLKKSKTDPSNKFFDEFGFTGEMITDHPIGTLLIAVFVVYVLISHTAITTLLVETGSISNPRTILTELGPGTAYIYGDVKYARKTYSVPVVISKYCGYKEFDKSSFEIDGVVFSQDAMKVTYSSTYDGIIYEVENNDGQEYEVELTGPLTDVPQSVKNKFSESSVSVSSTIFNIVLEVLCIGSVVLALVMGLKNSKKKGKLPKW